MNTSLKDVEVRESVTSDDSESSGLKGSPRSTVCNINKFGCIHFVFKWP